MSSNKPSYKSIVDSEFGAEAIPIKKAVIKYRSLLCKLSQHIFVADKDNFKHLQTDRAYLQVLLKNPPKCPKKSPVLIFSPLFF